MLTVLIVSMLAAEPTQAPPQTVPKVELPRYVGTWYEIARFPQRFQKDCVATTATYTQRSDGRIDVVNRCRKDSLQGREKKVKGVAKVVEPQTNAKLKVRFFGPFWGDYWVVNLDPDYQWAVVSDAKRESLWILSRSPLLEEPIYEQIVEKLRADGYAVERLVRTLQWPRS
jgi:apolipoprotein D and lipocalin family protein